MLGFMDGRQFLLLLMIVGAAVCLGFGLTLPVIQLSNFYIDVAQHSLLTAVWTLFKTKEYFLGAIVLIFSILLPVLKLLYLLVLASLPSGQIIRRRKTLKALEWIGKWSMHDVLILALTIFYVKSTGIGDAVSLPGIYFFAVSVCLIILSYGQIRAKHRATFEDLEQNHYSHEILSSPSSLPVLRRYFIIIATVGAAVCLVLGITLPVIKLTYFYIWTNEHSIVSVISALYTDKEYFLAAIILIFSIVFPGIKMLYLLTVLLLPPRIPKKRIKLFEHLDWFGRWSMTDVMILALMIFYLNASALTDATTLPGIYFFSLSVFLTMAAYGGIKGGVIKTQMHLNGKLSDAKTA